MKDFHPVIQSLIERKNLSVPVGDGKKINLVLYGGTMLGVGGGAAVIALEELGLTNSFDNIYVVSAGLPNASYFLSKQTKLGTSIYYDNLNDRKFINPLKFWNSANTEKVVETIRNVKPLDVEKVISHKTNIFVRLLNIKTRKAEYINLKEYCKNCDSYFDLLKSSISFIEIFNPFKLIRVKYLDGALPSRKHIKDHLDYAISQGHTDILVIYPNKEYIQNLNSNNICEIVLPLNMSRFETRAAILKKEALLAGLCVKQTFGINEPVKLLVEESLSV